MPDAGATEPLTAAQLATYRDAGWVLARQFFSRSEIDVIACAGSAPVSDASVGRQ